MGSMELVAPGGSGRPTSDKQLAQTLAPLSRSAVQKLISSGDVTVNGDQALASYIVAEGDRECVALTEPEEPSGGQPPVISILYEDDVLLVVDKPAGLVVHEGSGHTGHTLVSALLAMRPELGAAGMDPRRPGIVHRLDRDTSGTLVVAKTPASLAALQRQFRRREVSKRYLALVHGSPAPARAAIEAPIGRDETNRARMSVAPGGRSARTEYETLERFRDVSLISVNLLTGRTHQIRVHMAAIGHPVVGDRTYGVRRDTFGARRQMLHAQRLVIAHPSTQEPLTCEAPVPDDMRRVLDRLRSA